MATGGAVCLGRLIIDEEDCGRAAGITFVPNLAGVALMKDDADPIGISRFAVS